MGRNITPILRPLRGDAGTLYVFPSASEDIGLNLNQRDNKVALTHYALLNLPEAKWGQKKISDKNYFNLASIPGIANRFNGNVTMKDNQLPKKIAAALQNYAMNFETVLMNRGDYNYTDNNTVSERVFMKFLKETGAIRFKKVEGVTLGGESIYEEYPEKDADGNPTGYKRVFQCMGEISAGNSRSTDFGMYNETYVNVPTSYGCARQFFRSVSDGNYTLGKVYSPSDTETERLEGRNPDTDGYVETVYTQNTPYFDFVADVGTTTDNTGFVFSYVDDEYDGYHSREIKAYQLKVGDSLRIDDENLIYRKVLRISELSNAEITGYSVIVDSQSTPIELNYNETVYVRIMGESWMEYEGLSLGMLNNAYATDTAVADDADLDIPMKVVENGKVIHRYKRSRLDGVQLINEIQDLQEIYDKMADNAQVETVNPLTYDYINTEYGTSNVFFYDNSVTNDNPNDALVRTYTTSFDFNAVLLYYSIYDGVTGNVLAVNLFGIVFLDGPVPTGDCTGYTLNFNFPVLKKKHAKDTDNHSFGTGYSFRVNVKSLEVYDDTEALIYDNTTSSSILGDDFAEMLDAMRRGVDKLGENTVILKQVQDRYTSILSQYSSLKTSIDSVQRDIDDLRLGRLTDSSLSLGIVRTKGCYQTIGDVANGMEDVSDSSITELIDGLSVKFGNDASAYIIDPNETFSGGDSHALDYIIPSGDVGAIDYARLVPVLVRGLQVQARKIKDLEETVAELHSQTEEG